MLVVFVLQQCLYNVLSTSWQPVIDKFTKKLSKWKQSILSIGGRATLVSSVLGALGTYYFSIFPMPIKVTKKLESIRSKFFWGHSQESKQLQWISWKQVLADKSKGGLGIGSLNALNKALLLKWKWRFINNPNSLWVNIIKHLHNNQKIGSDFSCKTKFKGVWSKIIGSIISLQNKNIIPSSMFKKEIGDGKLTSFWYDCWHSNGPLKDLFPRLFILDSSHDDSVYIKGANGWNFNWKRNIERGISKTLLDNLLNSISSITLSNRCDRWLFDNNIFAVKDARKMIDQVLLPSLAPATNWNRFLPKKINIFGWRVLHDRLPTRWNLSIKGFDIASILCPMCSSRPETAIHVFWECSNARNLWLQVSNWLDITIPSVNSTKNFLQWIHLTNLSAKNKIIVESITYVTLWIIWGHRNEKTFGNHIHNGSNLFEKVVYYSFLWFSNRNRKGPNSWISWMNHPLLLPFL